MANKKFDPGVNLLTPEGTFKFPKLQKPDTQFDSDGLYTCDLLLTPDEAKPLIEKLDKIYKDNLQKQAIKNDVAKIKGASKPWKEDKDHKTDEPTGLISFKCKAKAKRGEFDFKPKLFEADGLPFGHRRNEDGTIAPLASIPGIWTGSRGVLSLNVRGWYVKGEAGITLGLEAAQITKLVTGGRSTAEEYGFTPQATSGEDY